jgi:hypothetical protein
MLTFAGKFAVFVKLRGVAIALADLAEARVARCS